MKLIHLKENEQQPVFAWLEPSRGPEDIRGVRLAYIEPAVAVTQRYIEDAKREGNDNRIRNLERQLADLEKSGQKFYTPSFGWWMSEEDFYDNKEGFSGVTKDGVVRKHPGLVVLGSREAAIQRAEQTGQI